MHSLCGALISTFVYVQWLEGATLSNKNDGSYSMCWGCVAVLKMHTQFLDRFKSTNIQSEIST